MKAITKASIWGKKNSVNLDFQTTFLKEKGVYHRFGIIIPHSATYYLEEGAKVSLKAVTKASLRGK